MQAAPRLDNETDRLTALRGYQILDSGPAIDFQTLVEFLAMVCGTPIAAISLVDEHRQWIKAASGLAFRETSRDIAFCAHTIAHADGPFIVPDAAADDRFAENPLVTGDPHIRFYAGVPIVTDEGHVLGAICVIDQESRELTASQLNALGAAAHVAMTLIDHHAASVKLRLVEEARLAIEHEHRAMVDYVTQVEDERVRVANELHAEASRRTRFESELEYLKTHDALTTLPNRRQFMTHLRTAFAPAQEAFAPRRSFAIYIVDIDHCKQINDTLGDKVGDDLLVQCGERLLDAVGEDDIVARLDSDSFALITFDTPTVKAATAIARKIRTAFQAPWHLAQIDCVVTASIGVVVVDDRYASADDIFRDANIALDHSKQQGRDRYSVFKKSFGAVFASKVDLDRTLAQALANSEFRLVYQPIVSLAGGTRELEGFEALLRWQRQDGVHVSPAAFIPAAEESGLIVPLGAWVLKTACLQLREWRRRPGPAVRMSVNVSAIQLAETRFSATVRDIIRESNIDPHGLVIEVTESAAMLDPERSLHVLRELRELGIGIHVDDFGTGYSSLSYLRRLPVTRVKIDRSFVSADGLDHLVDCAIAGAIISLAHQLHVKVIAEGVETLTQLQTLQDLGCDSIQGYYISPPVPAAQATAFSARTDLPAAS